MLEADLYFYYVPMHTDLLRWLMQLHYGGTY